jgi:hypothetical protein
MALIEAVADVSAADSQGRTPLHMHEAAEQGNTAAADALLAAGSTLAAADKEGCTPLHAATRNARPELESCARTLPVHAARTAAAARKKQGYSHGLHQALLWRDRRSNAKTAAAAYGVKCPYGYRAVFVPYSLPGCLLRSKKSVAAASAAGGGVSGGQGLTRAQRSLCGEAARAGSSTASEAVGAVKKWVAGRVVGKKLALQRSGVHGYGLFAAERIRKDELVIEHVGLITRPVIEDMVEARKKAQGQDSSILTRCVLVGCEGMDCIWVQQG